MMKRYNRCASVKHAVELHKELKLMGIKHRVIKCGTKDHTDCVVFEIDTADDIMYTVDGLINSVIDLM